MKSDHSLERWLLTLFGTAASGWAVWVSSELVELKVKVSSIHGAVVKKSAAPSREEKTYCYEKDCGD